MAQLELANLASATGAAVKVIGVGTTVEADGGAAMAKSFSFSLLQADASGNPAVAVFSGLATGEAGLSAINPPAAQPGLELIDTTDLGKAGEQLMVAALTAGLTQEAGEGKPEESKESTTEAVASDSDTATGQMETEAVWVGLPLFMDARAALRNAGASDVASSSSTVSVDAARLRLIRCSTPASGRLADGGGGLARPTGEPVSEALAGLGLVSAVSPSLAPDPTAGAASGAAMTKPQTGAAASLAEGWKAEIARPADSQSPSDLVVATGPAVGPAVGSGVGSATGPAVGPAAESVAGEATAVAVEEAVAVGQTNGIVPRSDAPSAASAASTHAISVGAISAEEESGAAGRTGAVSDPRSAQPASGHPLQWHPRLAESLARIGSEPAAAGQLAPAGNEGTIEQASQPTAAADKNRADAARPLPPAGQELASLLASNQAPGRPADTVAALAAGRPEEAVREVAAIRAGEPAGPANGGAPTQAGASSSTPARPEAAASPASLPTTPDVLNLNQKNWERTLGHQLNWMVNNRLQEAEIKVNPPDLGPLEVRVSQHHNQTNVTFFSHEAAVREALESALPRLREMLDGQGISLNQAQVSDQSLARQQAGAGEQPSYGQRDGGRPAATPGAEAAMEAEESSRPRSRNPLGMVDDYA